MAETNKSEWVRCTFTHQAASFEKVQEILEEKGVEITPRDYIEACQANGLTPDIDPVFVKIAEGTATLEDVNLLLEDVGASVEERIKRRIRRTPTKGHITHGGRQRLGGVRMKARTNPKRERSGHTQSHGRGEHGHDKSTDKQRRKAKSERNGGDAS